jgi:decaprenyl-phosphate phosphoribosyltransferase
MSVSEDNLASLSVAVERIPQNKLRGHIEIARLDHWVKNISVLPGIAAALAFGRISCTAGLVRASVWALLATGLIASSNYVLNELMDAPFDRYHPTKCGRPVPSGRISIPVAYVEWILLAAVGLTIARALSGPLMLALVGLWGMGCVYNVPPVRTKDIPYLDVLTEAINNPLRLLIGWFVISPNSFPPLFLLLSYWMVGCYAMALKRYAEHLQLRSEDRRARYRKSLAFFSASGLLVSIMFYATTSMLLFGAFLISHRLELILTFPAIALVMAVYLSLAFKPDSAVEHPEKLYREPKLMLALGGCIIVMILCIRVDMPKLHRALFPSGEVERLNVTTR